MLEMFNESIIFSLKDIEQYNIEDIKEELDRFMCYYLVIVLKEKK